MTAIKRRGPSPLMTAATARLESVADEIVRGGSRFRHSMELDIDLISPAPDQARKSFDEEETATLAKTLAEQGQLQAILVRRDPEGRGRWLIVAGERRWRAAKSIGWKTILAIEHTGDPEVAGLVENLQRVDLSIVEEARGLQRLITEKGWSQSQAAQVLGKTDAEISSTLRILTLPEDLLDDLLATKKSNLSRYVLAELARVEDGPVRERLIAAARNGELTQRMIRITRAADNSRPIRETDTSDNGETERFPFKAVKNMIESIRRLRQIENQLADAEKQSLQHLRHEIDDLLKSQA